MLNGKTMGIDKKFDLEERTSAFAERVLNFCKEIKINFLNESLVKQLIRSSTSIGANYMEANGSGTKKDFKNKISICKKEAKETVYWLRILLTMLPQKKELINNLRQEAQELVLIFSSIIKKL